MTRTDVTPSLTVTAEITVRRFTYVRFAFSKTNKQSVNTTQYIPTVKNISSPYNTRCGDGLFIASIDSCNTWHSPVRQSQASSFRRLINMSRQYMYHIIRRIFSDYSMAPLKQGTTLLTATSIWLDISLERYVMVLVMMIPNIGSSMVRLILRIQDVASKNVYPHWRCSWVYSVSPGKCSDSTCDQQSVRAVVIIQRYTAPADDSVLSIPKACNQAASVT